jgi:hypothetical protein
MDTMHLVQEGCRKARKCPRVSVSGPLRQDGRPRSAPIQRFRVYARSAPRNSFVTRTSSLGCVQMSVCSAPSITTS